VNIERERGYTPQRGSIPPFERREQKGLLVRITSRHGKKNAGKALKRESMMNLRGCNEAEDGGFKSHGRWEGNPRSSLREKKNDLLGLRGHRTPKPAEKT